MPATTTRNTERALQGVSDRLQLAMLRAVDRYHAAVEGGATPVSAAVTLTTDLHAAIDEGYRTAYGRGAAVQGVDQTTVELSPRAQGELSRQKRFAFRLALDVARGFPSLPGRMSIGPRVTLYARALRGAYNAGAVGNVANNYQIWWRLSETEHCLDCPPLHFSSPYTITNIPTYPGAGATTCRANCTCFLDFQPLDEASEPQDEPIPVRERLLGNPGVVPEGLKLPTAAEKRIVRDFQHRIAFAARKVEAARSERNSSAEKQWKSDQEELERSLADYEARRGIFTPKTLSANAQLDNSDINPSDLDWVVRDIGIDGYTTSSIDQKAKRSLLTTIRAGISRFIALLPFSLPFLPDPEDIERLSDLEESQTPLRSPGALFSTETTLRDGSGSKTGLEGLSEASEALSGRPEPGDEIVVRIMGPGVHATLKGALGIAQRLQEAHLDVEVGPFGENWIEQVADIGFWIRGRRNDVEELIKSAKDVEVFEWVS